MRYRMREFIADCYRLNRAGGELVEGSVGDARTGLLGTTAFRRRYRGEACYVIVRELELGLLLKRFVDGG
jgi:hypothetical protein